MSKYKVRYFEDAKVVEKEVEASSFDVSTESKLVVFYVGNAGVKHETHAFSDFLSIEKI